MSIAAPYADQLVRPRPCDHLIQLYTDETFLRRVVVEFLSAGLANGEGAVVIATPAHLTLFTEGLRAARLDVTAAETRGQLVLHDADACLARFMVDGMPDRERFCDLVKPVLADLGQSGYSRVRLYGEMVDLLWNHSMPATVALEQLWNEVLAETRVSLLCAYRIDNFDQHIQRGVLHRLTACHSQLIPVEDYDRLERAVSHAYDDVFGASGEAALLRDHVATLCEGNAKMPPAQAALLGLNQVAPLIADSVIERARHHYQRT
jgi:MEDS: MEthanogen/methylotroph, DcmR Sensory domain